MDSKIDSELKDATYFKYRPLDNFERFLDIVLKKRLYGALYHELNDPMEGKFSREGLEKDQLDIIYSLLKKTRICSLMKKKQGQSFPDDFLMWSHYADSHKGCCLELEITERNNSQWQLVPITYTNSLPKPVGPGKDAVELIISTKTELWKGENEVRAYRVYDTVSSNALSPYYSIKIKAIYLGKKINSERCDFIKRIITAIDNKIKVYKMEEDFISQGFYPILTPKEL